MRPTRDQPDLPINRVGQEDSNQEGMGAGGITAIVLVTLLGITIVSLVVLLIRKRQLPFDVVIDPSGAVVRAFGDVKGTPSHFVLDRQGRVAAKFQGAAPADALQQLISGLLAET